MRGAGTGGSQALPRHARALASIAAALFGSLSPFALAAAPTPNTDAGKLVLSSDVMIAMRDGTQLATDIYRPALNGPPRAGRSPVLLMRTPYHKDTRPESFASQFAAAGYVVIVQDVRGRYKSQ